MQKHPVLNRGVKMMILSGIAATITYLLAHATELQLDPMWTTLLIAVLTGIEAALENAIKHWGQVPPVR